MCRLPFTLGGKPVAESAEARKVIAIRDYQTSIETRRFGVSELERVLKDPSQNANNVDTSSYPDVIKRDHAAIADIQTNIANLEKDWHPIDLGLPDSLGYAAGPTLYAFLLRDGRAYPL